MSSDALPRGGFKLSNKKTAILKMEKNLFGGKLGSSKNKRPRTRKTFKSSKISNFHVENTDLQLEEGSKDLSADTLTYSKISEGMILLGCIRKIKSLSIECELPGRTFGDIFIKNISSHLKWTKQSLQSEKADAPLLNELFHVGQYVTVSVVNISGSEKGLKIDLTTNPTNINSLLRHDSFYAKNLVWGAICEKSDNGYIVDLGVCNTKTHLPFNLCSSKDYQVGQVMYMAITNVQKTKESSTLTVSTLKEHLEDTIAYNDCNLDHLIPGTQVDFTVKNLLKNGLQGTFLSSECVGFVNELYLKKPFDKLTDHNEEQTLKATFLYTQPLSKHSFLTLKSLTDGPEFNYATGAKVISSVVSKIKQGLVIKLEDGSKGFITNRRLQKSMNVSNLEEGDLESLISKKYPLDTKRTCTVLSCDYMECMYICTFEKNYQIYSIESLKVGQTVRAEVRKHINAGLKIKMGAVNALIPNAHLSNIAFNENIKKQFKIGQKITGKIWAITASSERVLVTVKRDLLHDTNHLMSVKDIVLWDTVYLGVVSSVSRNGVLLVFFGDVKGWLPFHNVPHKTAKKCKKEFYIGLILKVRVSDCSKNKITLTQYESLEEKNESIKAKGAAAEEQIKKQTKRKGDDVMDNTPAKVKKTKKDPFEEAAINAIVQKNPTKKEKKKKMKETDKQDENFETKPLLPGMTAFFNLDAPKTDETQEEIEEDEVPDSSKTKKQTPAERALQRKQEEERLRQIENELADSSHVPQSAEQFDRALMGNPLDSELWTRYIAFHAQSTEFDKARSVARQALSRIPYNCCQERLNIWLAYLNLENFYGTGESFEKVFEEAARSNDELTIYLETIKMLCEMQKWNEMYEKIRKARGKFRNELNMWLEIGKVFYKCHQIAEARKLKDQALLSLTDKQSHMKVIVQFARMEFLMGESAHGEAMLEAVLQVDPRRYEIWCVYVDQLIKIGKIDIARNVLKRAAGQRLNYKQMRALFKKFYSFEVKHGNAQTQNDVKEMLKEFSLTEQEIN